MDGRQMREYEEKIKQGDAWERGEIQGRVQEKEKAEARVRNEGLEENARELKPIGPDEAGQ